MVFVDYYKLFINLICKLDFRYPDEMQISKPHFYADINKQVLPEFTLIELEITG